MKIIMFLLLSFVFIYLISQIIYYIVKYHRHLHGSGYFLELDCLEYEMLPRLTFKQFLSFYNVNPDKWLIMDEERWYYHPTRLYKNKDDQPIAFKTIFDYIKYVKWIKKQFKNKKEKERDKKLQAIVDDVKKDIQEVQEEHQKAIEDGFEIMNKVISNTKYHPLNCYYIKDMYDIDKNKLPENSIIIALNGKYIWHDHNFFPI